MNYTQKHAKRELTILKKTQPDSVVIEFEQQIIELCKAFGASGQSGGSAPYVARAVAETARELMLHNMITPLTGEDDEWSLVEDDDGFNFGVWQNKRMGSVFKNEEGAYYLDAIIFETAAYAFTGRAAGVRSRQFIKEFPFVPKTFRVTVIEEGDDYSILDYNTLQDAMEYYKQPEVEK